MVIYNTKVMLVNNGTEVRSYRFPWFPGISCDIFFYLLVMLLGNQGKLGNLWQFLLCQHSCWSNRWTYVPMWFMCISFSDLSYSNGDITILLPFIAVKSIIVISALNGQNGCRSFCTFGLVWFGWWPAMWYELWQCVYVLSIWCCYSYFFCCYAVR